MDDSPGNHFDGANKNCSQNFSVRYCFGGDLSGNGTAVWIKRHPQANFTEDFLWIRARISRSYQNAQSRKAYLHEIGFGDNTPTVEPRMGTWDQLYITWEDTERLHPNSPGTNHRQGIVARNDTRLLANQHYHWDSRWNQPTVNHGIYFVYDIFYTNDLNDDLTEETTDTSDDWHKESLGWHGRIFIEGCNHDQRNPTAANACALSRQQKFAISGYLFSLPVVARGCVHCYPLLSAVERTRKVAISAKYNCLPCLNRNRYMARVIFRLTKYGPLLYHKFNTGGTTVFQHMRLCLPLP